MSTRATGRSMLQAAALAAMVAGCAAPEDSPAPPGASPSLLSASHPATEPGTTAEATPEATAAPTPAPLAWHTLDVAGPPGREDHTWTVAPDGATAYLFGGREGATVFGDLWAFDLSGDSWSAVDAPAGPAARFGHEAVWVDGVGLVIFAGQAGATFFNDLWAFDPANGSWRQLPSGGDVPVARYGTCAAIGPDGRLWISHGFTSDGTRFADTRAYDFDAGTWSDETPDGDLPVSRCLHGCWFTADGALALFGGQTTGITALDDRWRLGGGGWQRVEGVAPHARNLYARARLGEATLVFGGQALDGSRLADAWLLVDGEADAVAIEAEGDRPPGRSGAEMVIDAARGRILLFGGLGEAGALADTRALDAEPLLGR